jgi:hypothetical protein
MVEHAQGLRMNDGGALLRGVNYGIFAYKKLSAAAQSLLISLVDYQGKVSSV